MASLISTFFTFINYEFEFEFISIINGFKFSYMGINFTFYLMEP